MRSHIILQPNSQEQSQIPETSYRGFRGKSNDDLSKAEAADCMLNGYCEKPETRGVKLGTTASPPEANFWPIPYPIAESKSNCMELTDGVLPGAKAFQLRRSCSTAPGVARDPFGSSLMHNGVKFEGGRAVAPPIKYCSTKVIGTRDGLCPIYHSRHHIMSWVSQCHSTTKAARRHFHLWSAR